MTQAGAMKCVSHILGYLYQSLTRVVLDGFFKSRNGCLLQSVFLVQEPRQGSSEQTQRLSLYLNCETRSDALCRACLPFQWVIPGSQISGPRWP